MLNFLKKKNNESPPDIGKEEVIEYKEDAEDNLNNIPDKPYEEISNRADFRNKAVKRKSQLPPSFPQSLPEDKTNFDLEKINARLELINSLITAFNERFSRINQQIGEIRAMTISNEKNLSISNLDAKKVVDIVKEVNPEKLRVDYQKADLKLSTLVEKIESYKLYMDSIMGELKDLKRRANLFEGTDALLKLDEDVKKDLIEIQKVNARVKMNADKSEQIFIELSKGFNENRKMNEMIMNLDNSYSGLKKEIEKLNLDYKQVIDIDAFNDFKKKIANKLMILENSFLEIQKIKEENDKLAKGLGKILLIEKRNEEDIANIGFNRGNNNIQRVSDYEQKIFSILEIIEKMTLEIDKVKEKVGIKISTTTGEPSIPKTEIAIPKNEISEEYANNRGEIERLRIENEKRINDLLVQGRNYLANGDLTMAWKIYKDIFDLYNPAGDNNSTIYYKIINFYDTLSEGGNNPVVVSASEPEPEKFPPIEERKYKQLSDY